MNKCSPQSPISKIAASLGKDERITNSLESYSNYLPYFIVLLCLFIFFVATSIKSSSRKKAESKKKERGEKIREESKDENLEEEKKENLEEEEKKNN